MINIVLFQPEKPANTGNIIRTCMAIGATLHIIGPTSFSMEDKELKRASMDYIKDVDLRMYDSYEDFIDENDEPEVFYVTRYANKVYSSNDYSQVTKDYYFMFGKESSGIPHDILLKHQDHLIRIPMVLNARSLNLSNSVAIIAYEALKQQSFFNLATKETIKGENFLKEEDLYEKK